MSEIDLNYYKGVKDQYEHMVKFLKDIGALRDSLLGDNRFVLYTEGEPIDLSENDLKRYGLKKIEGKNE